MSYHDERLVSFARAAKLIGRKPAATNRLILSLMSDSDSGRGPRIEGKGHLVNIEQLRFAMEQRRSWELVAGY